MVKLIIGGKGLSCSAINSINAGPYPSPVFKFFRLKLLSKKSFWLHSIFFTLLQRFSTIFFGLITTIILFRFFQNDKMQMQIWALYATITTLVEMVKQGLLRNALVKFLHQPDFAAHKQEVQSASLFINIMFTALVILLIIFGGKALSNFLKVPDMFLLLLMSIPLFILQIVYNHCEIVQQANMQYPPIFRATVIRQGVQFVGIVLLYFFFKPQLTLVNMVWLQIISLVAATFYFFNATKQYLTSKFVYNKKIVIQLLHFGKYVFGTNLFSQINRFTDQFYTSAVSNPAMGPTIVTYYSVVSRLSTMVDVPSIAAADVLFPKNAQASGEVGNEKVKYYFERMGGILLALIIPISVGVFIFPELVIKIIGGKKYLGAVPILQVTILFSIVRPLMNQFGTTMDAIGKPQINFWVNTLILALNIVCIYFGIKFGGDIMGAAYGTVATNIISFFLIYIVLRKTLNIELKNIITYIGVAYADLYKTIRKFIQRNETA